MLKPALRTKSISTKVTDEEYLRLEEFAGATGQSMSEWVRTILLDRPETAAARRRTTAKIARRATGMPWRWSDELSRQTKP